METITKHSDTEIEITTSLPAPAPTTRVAKLSDLKKERRDIQTKRDVFTAKLDGLLAKLDEQIAQAEALGITETTT